MIYLNLNLFSTLIKIALFSFLLLTYELILDILHDCKDLILFFVF